MDGWMEVRKIFLKYILSKAMKATSRKTFKFICIENSGLNNLHRMDPLI